MNDQQQIQGYLTAPNTNEFWDNLNNAADTILNAYKQYQGIQFQSALGSVLVNPNTQAGSIFTTGTALSKSPSYNMILIMLFIIVLVYLIFV